MHLMVSFLTGLELITNDNFDGDNYDDGSDFMVHEEYEADQYTSIGKKGQQRMEQMAEIQKL